MKLIKRIILPVLICALMLFAFTACHSHNPTWRIDKDSHWKECDCGEISEKGAHTFENEVCTLCGAEKKTEDGKITEIGIGNDYGDWVQWLYFDEDEAQSSECFAEYTYDKDGNKLTDKIYEDGQLISSGEFEYDDQGLTYKKYETEYYEDGTKCVNEFNESGDSLGYVLYDEEGNPAESYRSEYITDEKGDLVGEKVYENDVLIKEMKYASANDGEEDYLYITEETNYSDDGSKTVEIYDESGDIIKELSFDTEGEKIYEYDLEYFFDNEGNLTSVEKREGGVLKQEIVYEYGEEGELISEKTYEGDRLIREAQYEEAEYYSYEAKVITYNEDGTTTVEEFDETGELIG